MSGWEVHLGPGYEQPVRGVVSDFEQASGYWRSAELGAIELRQGFTLFKSGVGSLGIEGDAAGELLPLVNKIGEWIGFDLERICDQFAVILDDHERDLSELNAECGRALNRAQVRAAASDNAQRDVGVSDGRVSVLRRQIEEAQSLGQDVTQLDDDYDWAVRQRASRERTRDETARSLEDSRAEHRALIEREDQLNQRTAGSLRGIDFGKLGDPSNFDRVVGYISSFGKYFSLDVRALAEAFYKGITEGSWDELLFAIRREIDEALDLLSVIGIALLVAGIFITGGALAVALLVVAALTLGLAATKFVFELLVAGETDPVTGETITAGTILGSAIEVALAVVGVRSAASAVRATKFTHVFERWGSLRRWTTGLKRYNLIHHEVPRIFKEIGVDEIKDRAKEEAENMMDWFVEDVLPRTEPCSAMSDQRQALHLGASRPGGTVPYLVPASQMAVAA